MGNRDDGPLSLRQIVTLRSSFEMKAVRYHEYGDPNIMRIEDIDRPEPGPGQVLVQVTATAFNQLDATMRAGYLQ